MSDHSVLVSALPEETPMMSRARRSPRRPAVLSIVLATSSALSAQQPPSSPPPVPAGVTTPVLGVPAIPAQQP